MAAAINESRLLYGYRLWNLPTSGRYPNYRRSHCPFSTHPYGAVACVNIYRQFITKYGIGFPPISLHVLRDVISVKTLTKCGYSFPITPTILHNKFNTYKNKTGMHPTSPKKHPWKKITLFAAFNAKLVTFYGKTNYSIKKKRVSRYFPVYLPPVSHVMLSHGMLNNRTPPATTKVTIKTFYSPYLVVLLNKQ